MKTPADRLTRYELAAEHGRVEPVCLCFGREREACGCLPPSPAAAEEGSDEPHDARDVEASRVGGAPSRAHGDGSRRVARVRFVEGSSFFARPSRPGECPRPCRTWNANSPPRGEGERAEMRGPFRRDPRDGMSPDLRPGDEGDATASAVRVTAGREAAAKAQRAAPREASRDGALDVAAGAQLGEAVALPDSPEHSSPGLALRCRPQLDRTSAGVAIGDSRMTNSIEQDEKQ